MSRVAQLSALSLSLMLSLTLMGLGIPRRSTNSTSAVSSAMIFSIEVSPHIAQAPVALTVRARLDPDVVRGGVCIVVSGEEEHSSCWVAEELRMPLVVRRFVLERAGEYAVVMRGEGRSTPVASVLLN